MCYLSRAATSPMRGIRSQVGGGPVPIRYGVKIFASPTYVSASLSRAAPKAHPLPAALASSLLPVRIPHSIKPKNGGGIRSQVVCS